MVQTLTPFIQWFPTPAFAWIFFLAFFIWVAIEFINHLIGKWGRLGGSSQTKERGSYWLISIMAYLSFSLAFASRFLGLGVITGSIQYAGFALMLGGVAFREWSIIVLGRHFSIVVAVETNHQLVSRGPYRWLRHPAYSGGYLAMLGFHLALGNWITTLLTAIMLLPAFVYRIRIEEQVLFSTFGEEYQAYVSRTWRLFPGW